MHNARQSWKNLSLYLVLIFFGCGGDAKIRLNEISKLSINLPYRPLIYKSGTITIREDSSLLYFYNPATYSRIDFFSEDLRLVKTISLRQVKRKCKSIHNIAVFNTDSIYVLSQNPNQVFLLNDKGDVINQRIFLDSSFTHFNLELSSSLISGFLFQKDILVFKANYYPYEKTNRFRNYYSFNRQSPYFATIRLSEVFNPSAPLKFHLPDFYSRFLKPGDCNVEPPLYAFAKDKLLMGSVYTDTVYVLDSSFSIRHKLKLSSKILPLITCKPMRYAVSGRDELLEEDSLDARRLTSAMLSNIQFDPYRNLYYITVIHPIDPSLDQEEKYLERKSSILIYDPNFVFIQEIVIPTGLTDELYIRRKGLIWKLNDNDETDHYKFAFYDVKIY